MSGFKTSDAPKMWGHGEDTVIVDEAVTVEEALSLAGLDWDVELVPAYVKWNGEDLLIPNHPAVQRVTDGHVVGVAGNGFHPVGNRDAFAWYDELIGAGQATVKAAGELKGGRQTYLIAQLSRTIKIGGDEGELVNPYLYTRNAFDRSSSLIAAFNMVRAACTNQLPAIFGRSPRVVRIRHTRNAGTRMDEALRVFAAAENYMADFEQGANELVRQKMSVSEFKTLLGSLLPIDPTANLETDRAARNKQEAQDAIEAIFNNADNLANVRGTKWAAYNAVAEYADHKRRSRKGNGTSVEENRFLRQMEDTKLKDQALALLTN